ncbi:hypothetical protein [Methylomagnum sp.]
MSDKKSYPVLSPIRQGGKIIKPGAGVTVELADDEAEELRALGAIGATMAAEPEATEPEKAPKAKAGAK